MFLGALRVTLVGATVRIFVTRFGHTRALQTSPREASKLDGFSVPRLRLADRACAP